MYIRHILTSRIKIIIIDALLREGGVQFDNNKYIRSKKQYNKRLFDLISSKVRTKAINKDRVRNEMEGKRIRKQLIL